MNPMLNKALRAYNQVEVETVIEQASPHKLILMLFEGAIKSANQAQIHMKNGEVAAKGQAISRTIQIIDNGLKSSLNLEAGGAIAAQLFELYEYMLRQLLLASLRNDSAPLQEVIRLLTDLRDTWSNMNHTLVPQAETAAP